MVCFCERKKRRSRRIQGAMARKGSRGPEYGRCVGTHHRRACQIAGHSEGRLLLALQESRRPDETTPGPLGRGNDIGNHGRRTPSRARSEGTPDPGRRDGYRPQPGAIRHDDPSVGAG